VFIISDEDACVVGEYPTMHAVRAWVEQKQIELEAKKVVERIGADQQHQFIFRIGQIGTLHSLVISPVYFVVGPFMQTKMILRVIDAAGKLLGWAEFMAEARGDGRLWAPAPVSVAFEEQGTPAELSVHWVDVNVETRQQFQQTLEVFPGQSAIVLPAGPVLVVGMPAGGLPPVTVKRSVSIGIPVGNLAGTGYR
jgi:hypothetical protein